MFSTRSAVSILALGLLAGGVLLVPDAYRAGRLVAYRDVEDIARYRLGAVAPQAYEDAIKGALENDDPELADSLVQLADSRQVSLPPGLRDRVTDAQAIDVRRSLRETWKGLASGDAGSPEALAGAVAADLSGAGDIRDLYREGRSWVENGTYDPLTLGLAVVGLAATGATYLSIGTASPARVGITALKSASRADIIRPPLRRAMTDLATDVIDRPALERSLQLIRQGDLTAARQALTASVRAAPLQSLRLMSTDMGTIIRARGYRAGRDVLARADTPADLARYSTLASQLGPRFRGTLALLGTSALTLAGLTLSLAGWLVSALLWLVAAAFMAYRVLRWIFRIAGKSP